MDEERRHPTAAPGVPAPRPKRPQRPSLTGAPSIRDAIKAAERPETLPETRDLLAKTYGLMLMEPDIQRNIRTVLRRQKAADVVAMLRELKDIVLPPKEASKGGGGAVIFNNNTVPRPASIDITTTKGSA